MNHYVSLPGINLKRTLFCGQAFRWKQTAETIFEGVAQEKFIKLKQEENGISLIAVAACDVDFWEHYFDSTTDYEWLLECFSKDNVLKMACEHAAGLRVLRQPAFETLISFIISQNNNIKRITQIIHRICEEHGAPIKKGIYSFPSPDVLAGLSVRALEKAGVGYRARYIINAAQMTVTGDINLDSLYGMSAAEAKAELLKITGVGDKVADCVLLFAYGKTSAVPKDVWIKRALSEFFPQGLPECVGEHAGIAQQFLFEYIRNRNHGG
ncbi:MAG: DNA-3-methyladenine glycosylase 2 [Oscillospiraceae bacterium]|nr:DNA-3-methyladenine glycosylase 2 [Oscillospiraceae bacterium]